MPDLDKAMMTFYRVGRLFHELLRTPSQGVHQQFAIAALLSALLDEFGLMVPGGLRVETKNISASDASSKTPGDIQILRGNRVEEAFEVTANSWDTKISKAEAVIKQADLQRVHILAEVQEAFSTEFDALAGTQSDISVIDVEAFSLTLIAVMRKPARAAALVRFYELLDRLQPDINRVNAFVALLRSHGLAL
jgi:hypothetical protein